MSVDFSSSLIRSGIEIFRTKGILSTIRAGLRVLNLNYQGYWWYLKYVYRSRVSSDCQTSEPFSVVRVCPDRITRSVDHRIDRWHDLGAVIDGDWDHTGRTIDELIKYRSVVDHFENGTAWEETDIYREAIDRIERGEPYWNGSLTKDDLQERIEHIERLYDRIRTEGFKSQEELHKKPLREIVLDRHFDRSMEEIAVSIGRDGEILFVDGNHRLAISHVLDLETISVHVIARHVQWEAIRETVRSAPHPEQLDDHVLKHRTHPDLVDLFDSRP